MSELDELKRKPDKTPLDWAVLEHFREDAAAELAQLENRISNFQKNIVFLQDTLATVEYDNAQLRTARNGARKVMEPFAEWAAACYKEWDDDMQKTISVHVGELRALVAWLKAHPEETK